MGIHSLKKELEMANWQEKTIADAIKLITENTLVLPVIQRRLVWNEDKMALLFDTVLKGNSFGGIMAIEEQKDEEPLFAYREFSRDGSILPSIEKTVLEQSHFLVIDGQQRLQTFYMGLVGSYNGKKMYFDLFSDYDKQDYDFRFVSSETALPKKNNDRTYTKDTLWYPCDELFKELRKTKKEESLSKGIIKSKEISDDDLKDAINSNIKAFFRSLFINDVIGMAVVDIDTTLDKTENRQRIVELFRRLNDGGTRLSSYDLVASILKGFDSKMEVFLENSLKDFSDIGITQETLIKYVFILQDNPTKEMTNLTAADATYMVEKKERITASLKGLRDFLKISKLYNFYSDGQQSFVPLYFIGYHIFHSSMETAILHTYFEKYDIKNDDFLAIMSWIYLSLINGVFKSKGAGWIPYRTGINKILNVMKNYKGKKFPKQSLINVYYEHPVKYESIERLNNDEMDFSFIFYLLYDQVMPNRIQDVDHIHPYNIVSKEYSLNDVNSINNYQLIDYGTNRGEKNGKELYDWINNFVEDKQYYIKRHLIPEDEELWKSENFTKFIELRSKMIKEKVLTYYN